MSEHIKGLLGEYLDGELSPPEAKRVESHVSDCAGCRGELSDLRAVCEAVSGLGKAELPVGFRQRLERRRQDGEPAPAAGFLPAPARAAALAFSAAVAILIFYDKLPGVRPEPFQTTASDAGSGAQEEPKPSHKLARARGEPILGAAQAAPARPAPAAALAKKTVALSNEQLHARQEREKRAMGIKQILLPQEDDAPHPMGRMADMEAGGAAAVGAPASDAMTLSMAAGPTVVQGVVPQLLEPAAVRGALVAAESSASAAGFLLGSAQELAELWRRHGLAGPAPKVDWARRRLAVVVCEDLTETVHIVDVRAAPDSVTVLYRLEEVPDGTQRRSPSVRWRLLPRTGVPVSFERVP